MKISHQRASAVALATAVVVFAGAANAAIVASFDSFGGSFPLYTLPPGETLVTDFSGDSVGPFNGGAVYNTGGGVTTGTVPGSFVAAPYTATGGTTGNFFADNSGQSSSWTLSPGVRDLALYIGSLDAGNELVIDTSDAGPVTFTGTDLAALPGASLPGDGTPTITGSTSNGRFTFLDTTGSITGFTISETGSDIGNSFEIAQVATSVPESTTWAMMLVGFLGLGVAGYRSSRKALSLAV